MNAKPAATESPLLSAPKRAYFVQWLVLLVALLVLGVQMVFDQNEARQRIKAETNSQLENYSLFIAEDLERRLNSVSVVLEHLRDNVPIQLSESGGAAVISKQLITLAQALEGIRTLTVFDVNGTVIVSNRSEIVGKNFANREYFQTILAQPSAETLYLSDPFTTVLGAYTITMARMLVGPQGEFAGLVSATIDSESMSKLLESIHAGQETSLSVIHGKGNLMAMIPSRIITPPGLSLRKPDSLFERHMNSGQTASLMSGMSVSVGVERMISMRTVQPTGLNMTSALVVSAARDVSEVFAAWEAQAKTRALIYLFVFLFSSLALFVYQRRQFVFDQQLNQKEDEQQRSLLVFQRFIDHLPGTAYLKDTDLRTLMANRAFKTLLGIDPASMIGKTSLELFPGEFGQKILDDDRKILESGKSVVIEEHFNGRDFESIKFV